MTKANGQMSKEIYLAGGCFWGAEHFLKQIEGVEATEVGYANGHTDRPTYEEVCTDKTGFAETVRVVYDPARVGLAFLLDLYFKAIDPTSVNQQGGDRGTQYRTGIYYVDEADSATIDQVLADQQRAVGEPPRRGASPAAQFLSRRGLPPGLPGEEPRGLLPSACRPLRVGAQGQARPLRPLTQYKKPSTTS